MMKTRSKMIIWFLIVIVVTSGIVVTSISRSLGDQFKIFLTAMSEGQISEIENFVSEEYTQNGWQGGSFEGRMMSLAKDNKISFVLKDADGVKLFEYTYEDKFDKWRKGMPMHMHRDWNEKFEEGVAKQFNTCDQG